MSLKIIKLEGERPKEGVITEPLKDHIDSCGVFKCPVCEEEHAGNLEEGTVYECEKCHTVFQIEGENLVGWNELFILQKEMDEVMTAYMLNKLKAGIVLKLIKAGGMAAVRSLKDRMKELVEEKQALTAKAKEIRDRAIAVAPRYGVDAEMLKSMLKEVEEDKDEPRHTERVEVQVIGSDKNYNDDPDLKEAAKKLAKFTEAGGDIESEEGQALVDNIKGIVAKIEGVEADEVNIGGIHIESQTVIHSDNE